MPDSERKPARIRRERRTVRAMLEIYCRRQHENQGALCASCGELLAYAFRRLECCPFGAEKPTCARCPIHCYQRERRAKIKEVMKFSGPRMFFRHPFLALGHLWDSYRSRKASRFKRGSSTEKPAR